MKPLNVLQNLRKEFPKSYMNRRSLVTYVSKHYQHRLFFERTSEKGRFFLWFNHYPLYKKFKNIVLEYGSRLPSFNMRSDPEQEIVTYKWDLMNLSMEQIITNINDLTVFQREMTPELFASTYLPYAPSDKMVIHHLLIQAYTAFLRGEEAEALYAATICVQSNLDYDWTAEIKADAAFVVNCLKKNNGLGKDDLTSKIAEIESETLSLLS